MQLAVERIEDVIVVEVPVGELDAANADELKRDVSPFLDRPKLVVDLGRVRFVDSSGLGAFLSCLRKLEAQGGALKLCSLSNAVRSVFELSRLSRVFDIQPTRDAAVRAFATAAAR